jgi:hypothetical protein
MYLLFLIACQTSSTQPTTEKTAVVLPKSQPVKQILRKADNVACADLDGDGVDEHIFYDEGILYWKENQQPLDGQIQTFTRADRDGDGNQELLLATGFSKKFRTAAKEVHELTNDSLTTLWSNNGSRNQITDISVKNTDIFIATFSLETNIQGGWIIDGEFTPITEFNMAMKQKPLDDSIVVGRLYGDAKRSNGDLRIKTPIKEIMLPSFRGVRDVIIVDLNKDGHSDLLVSDGWHYQYGTVAKARISLYVGPDFEDIRTLANFNKDYTINRIELEQTKDGRTPRILAQGSRNVYVLEMDSMGWKSELLSPIAEGGSAVFCYADSTTTVLISGRESTNHILEK